MNKESTDNRHWSEIKAYFIDSNDECMRIDAWKTDNDAEPGETIAYVDTLSGRVIYANPLAGTDPYAQEVIQEVSEAYKKVHPYGVTELENMLRGVINYEIDELDLSAAQNNLKDMGFSNEEMVFFGFPESADESC